MIGYQTFLESKIELAQTNSAIAEQARFDSSLFPHQRDAARWALTRERALIAASFGLGKTRIQISLAKVLHEITGNPFMIVCPLGVRHQFSEEDGPALGTEWEYVRTDEGMVAAQERTPYLITNYERVRDGNIDPRRHRLAGVSLDEGSVIRSLGSKTYQVFQDAFAQTPHRFVCTATPSPNNYRELIYYAEFLGVMDKGQSLAQPLDASFSLFFIRDRAATQEWVRAREGEGFRVVAVSGVRADESYERAKLADWESPLNSFFGVWEWRPLLRWQVEDVWLIHHRYGIPRNKLYDHGAARVGCLPCIMSRKREVRLISKLWPDRVEMIEQAEGDFDNINGVSTFFARNKVPLRFRSKTIQTANGALMQVATIRDVEDWSYTRDRARNGGRSQGDLIDIDAPVAWEDAGLCPSKMGACE